jgi:hypothetical protein
VGFVVGLEVRRGPDWRLALDEYVAQQRSLGETIRVETVVRARKPWNFTPAMGTVEWESGIAPSLPPQAVRCALLLRRRPDSAWQDDSRRQVVFVVHHSDALYHVGWLAYAGPEEPFGPEETTFLDRIGCELRLD